MSQKRSKRLLEFLKTPRPICDLCQDHHSYISSPKEWKNVHVQRYVLSKGISADSSICRPCRQDDVTRAVANPNHTPRWEKGRKREKGVGFVFNGSERSIAHSTINSSELPQDTVNLYLTPHPFASTIIT